MKKIIITVAILLGTVQLQAKDPYFKADIGVFGLGNFHGTEVGYRFGTNYELLDLSLGYQRMAGGLDEPKIVSKGATVHRLGVEIGRSFPIMEKLNLRANIGGGMAVTDLDGRDKADNEAYGNFGVEVNRQITRNISLGLYLKGLLLRVHTKRTDYGSHIETLSNGQEVSVLDETLKAESINLHSGILGVSFVWKF